MPFPAVRRSSHRDVIGVPFYELMTAISALPIRHSFRDAATAEDNIPAFKHFEAFGAGLSIDDEYDFAAAVRALTGFAGYIRNVVFFLVHSAKYYKKSKKHWQKAKEALLAGLDSRRYPPSLSAGVAGRFMARLTLRTAGLRLTVLRWELRMSVTTSGELVLPGLLSVRLTRFSASGYIVRRHPGLVQVAYFGAHSSYRYADANMAPFSSTAKSVQGFYGAFCQKMCTFALQASSNEHFFDS